MTDTEINPSKSDETKLSAGNILATARSRQNLSLSDAAQHLKLGVKQLEALEADDYDKLPGRTFVRGFIRSYAKLLQIDPEPLLNSYPIQPPQQLRTVETSIGEIPSPYIDNKKWIKYSIAAVIIFAISVGVFLIRYEYKPLKKQAISTVPTRAPTATSIIIDKPQPQVLAPEPKTLIVPLKNDVVTDVKPPESVFIDSIPLPSITPSRNEKEDGLPQGNSGVLQLFFNEEAWVEVTDASNKVIFYQLNPAGVRRTIRGQPPLQIIVGNAAHVTMTYNNKLINLAPYIKVEVARLTLK